MTPKATQHIIRGMRQDTSNSKASKEFAFHNHNIRITAREDHTLLSITNEKMSDPINDVQGQYIGHCVVGDYLVLFIHFPDNKDKKDKIEIAHKDPLKDTLGTFTTIYEGNLNFSVDNPIEALGVYENEDIQKVYWVDGRNQPRVINITAEKDIRENWTDTSFDFIPELALQESVSIEAVSNSSMFAPGVIQYAFSYYNKNGQESNIFDVTPLCYISHLDRGASPEDVVKDIVFKITIDNPDTSFDFLKVYSIHRTSLDLVPTVKRLGSYSTKILLDEYILTSTYKYKLKGKLYPEEELLDDVIANNNGYEKGKYNEMVINYFDISDFADHILLEYDENEVLLNEISLNEGLLILKDNNKTKLTGKVKKRNVSLYNELEDRTPSIPFTILKKKILIYDSGTQGESIDPTTLLYMGGEYIIPKSITSKDSTLFLSNIKLFNDNISNNTINSSSITIEDAYIEKDITGVYPEDKYYFNKRELSNLTYFSNREIYRIGVQFQYKNGKWSRPYFIKDYTINNKVVFNETENKDTIQLPSIKISINEDTLNELKNKNILKYRILVVFPNKIERTIIDRGVVCPTLYNLKDREENNPYNQSSWFFRPIRNKTTEEDLDFNDNKIFGKSLVEFRDNNPLFYSGNKGGEIQNNINFFVDYSILTYHSPMTEFEDEYLNSQEVKARIVGCILMDESYGRVNIQTTSPAHSVAGGVINNELNDTTGDYSLVSDYLYLDNNYSEDNSASPTTEYLVYPWHRRGSLNYDNTSIASSSNRKQTALLKIKQLSNLKISNKINNLSNYDLNISYIDKFKEGSIRIPNNNGTYKNYFGNYTKFLFDTKKYPIYIKSKIEPAPVEIENENTKASEGVMIEYKSTPHYVLSLAHDCIFPYIFNGETKKVISDNNETLYTQRAVFVYTNSSSTIKNLENIGRGEIALLDNREAYIKLKDHFSIDNVDDILTNYYSKYEATNQVLLSDGGSIYKYVDGIWNSGTHVNNYKSISNKNTYKYNDEITLEGRDSLLYIVELYRDINSNTIFGGSTEEAIKNNIWVPASKSYNLDTPIICEYGDTRYQRYDCLKTYAYSPDSENQVVEILSFMCETRVNMLGRYDKNIGNLSNLNADPTNFNLFNPVYSQKDNFFNYRILDSDMYKLNNFPNTITWSKEKHAGEDIDSWTNITMASTLDLDGNKGEIKKLVVHNNRILAFQEKGIAEVLFNSRVQIPTSDGVPIEITNGYKVEGFRYISDGIGSKNKNSITVTPSGVYFLDSNSNSIYLLTDGLTNLSTEKGFEIWTKNVANESSFKTFYDNVNKDVYFTTSKECLGYSEKLGEFTSFYDYYNSDSMFNIGNSFYRLYYDEILYLDEMFAGDYTNNYSIEFITNENPYTDKVFSHIEYRADMFNMSDETYVPDYSFGKIKVSNEYQSPKEEDLEFKHYGKSNLKKKFRMWRAEIPRMGKDRIRNPWLKIKLSSKTDITNHRMELHDIIVHYFE